MKVITEAEEITLYLNEDLNSVNRAIADSICRKDTLKSKATGKAIRGLSLSVFAGLLCAACAGGSNISDVISEETLQTVEGVQLAGALPEVIPADTLEVLSDDAFNSLSPQMQYQVANKIHSTLFDGLPVHKFFDLDSGLYTPEPNGVFLPSEARVKINEPLTQSEKLIIDQQILGSDEIPVPESPFVESRFSFSRFRAQELPLARLYSYPLSRDKSSLWMAWHLANSILFSPATELDSVGMTDVQNILRRLDTAINNDTPISELVYEHMRSVENWRRFRSPEDNTREMLEIFLGLEDLDEQVPAASAACGDWYLTDESDGYQLSYTDYPNIETQTVLQKPVVSCDDFYRVVANHERLIPTMARTLVGFFFSSRSPEYHAKVVQQLVDLQPLSIRDLFMPILFSRSYLLESEKILGYEELFLSASRRMGWRPRADTFTGMVSGQGGMSRSFMGEMSWPAMSGKIGRSPVMPTDSLSFANYHKGFREDLVMRQWHWASELGIGEPEAPEPQPLPPPPEGASAEAISDYQTVLAFNNETIAGMTDQERADYEYDLQIYSAQSELHEQIKGFSLEEFIHYLFLTIVMREANSVEVETLIGLFDSNGYLRIEEEGAYLNRWSRVQAAVLVMDYLTRLPETYHHKLTGDLP